MDFSSTSKAELLVSYIVARYGLKTLGNFRVLASIPYYQQQAEPEMLSFEKVVREQESITWNKHGHSTVFTCGSGMFKYNDDPFGTITGALVSRVKTLLPHYCRFKSGPVVQLAHGCDVNKVVSALDMKLLSKVASTMYEQNAELGISYGKLEKAIAAYDTQQPLAVYDLCEAIHGFFVLARNDEKQYKFEKQRICPIRFRAS